MGDPILPPPLAGLVPFVVAPTWNQPHLDLAPLGLRIARANIFDPLRRSSSAFLTRLERLDALTFGPEGMPMPRWLFFDGAEMPAAIFGLGRDAGSLSAHARTMFGLSTNDEGLVPYAMYIAVPMMRRGSFMGHNLASLNRVLPEEGLRGLASATKALGIALLRARRVFGATQWRSPALAVHTRFGALELVTAYTPAHSNPRTLTYCFPVTRPRLRAAIDPPQRATRPHRARWIDADDDDALRALHDEIRSGARWAISGPPRIEGERVRVPITRRRLARRERE
jgi:hypothetical protein